VRTISGGEEGHVMLDLDHPLTPHVFAAARQLDLIGDYCKRITYADSKERLSLLEIIRPCFVALRWLNAQRFEGSPKIASGIDLLERQAEELARLVGGDVKWAGGELPAKCPVCGQPLTLHGIYEPWPGLKVPKERWCSPCLELVIPALMRIGSSEEGFGTHAI
jgi:hypothetical protein